MKKYLRLMRVKHYIKNVLIFAPLIFSGYLFEKEKLINTIFGCLFFSFAASFVYIFNDIKDVESDREHLTKKKRPLASGEINIHCAVALGSVLIVLAIAGNWWLEKNVLATIYLCMYILLNLLYSMKVKKWPILDIAVLVSGFLLRVLYGGALAQIEVSEWLYLTVIFSAFYLVLGKRRNELIQQKNKSTREVLQYYSVNFLDKHMYLCMAATIVFYALWAMEKENIILVFTVPIVLLVFMRYNLNVEGASEGDPVEVLFEDKIILLICGLYGIVVLGALYLF